MEPWCVQRARRPDVAPIRWRADLGLKDNWRWLGLTELGIGSEAMIVRPLPNLARQEFASACGASARSRSTA